MSHFDYLEGDRGTSEEVLNDHTEFTLGDDGRIHEIISWDVVV